VSLQAEDLIDRHDQTEIRDKTNAHQRKILEMESDLGNKRLKRKNLEEQIVWLLLFQFLLLRILYYQQERQMNIRRAERQLEDEQSIQSELSLLQGDIDEKKSRLKKLRSDFSGASYDLRLQEKFDKGKRLEETREKLNMEIRTLSLQADSRARLDVKRAEVKSKTNEASNT